MAKLNKEGDDDDQAPTRRGVHRGERLASSCRHNHENSSIILPLPLFLNIIIIFPLNTKRDLRKKNKTIRIFWIDAFARLGLFCAPEKRSWFVYIYCQEEGCIVSVLYTPIPAGLGNISPLGLWLQYGYTYLIFVTGTTGGSGTRDKYLSSFLNIVIFGPFSH